MEDNAELESFRRQWREEVLRRTGQQTTSRPQHDPIVSSSEQIRFPPTRHEASDRKEDEVLEEDSEQHSYGEFVQRVEKLSLGRTDEDGFQPSPQKEPSSALEHFEKAVEKEAAGSLGDSLSHYRKAYRLDSSVDKTYRKKHFAHVWKPAQPTPSQAPIVTREATPVSQEEHISLPTPELIASFANLRIPQAEPVVENTPPPPCPISDVPSEVIVEILRHVAVIDPALLPRLALVCKRLAYHVAHEQHIWKRLCQGPEFGFESMHYSFACDVVGNPTYTLGPRYNPFPRGSVQLPKQLSTWSQVFQTFPRIRFTGVYISTVNYSRPGASSAFSSVSWNTPIHIVTYYRYLRFYRDGSVISLLTTTEPLEVVPHISKENLLAARATASSQQRHLRHISDSGATVSGEVANANPAPLAAMAAMKHALRGRWHLTRPTPVTSEDMDIPADSKLGLTLPPSKSNQTTAHDPRDLVIETEGVDPKYTYTLHLSLRSPTASRPAGPNQSPPNVSKNTKLAWKGFWSYNKLTDDWAEFGLRNDRAFVFRRVRGWGMD